MMAVQSPLVEDPTDASTVMMYKSFGWKFLGIAETEVSVMHKFSCQKGHLQLRSADEIDPHCSICQKIKDERVSDFSSGVSGLISGIFSGVMKAIQEYGHARKQSQPEQ